MTAASWPSALLPLNSYKHFKLPWQGFRPRASVIRCQRQNPPRRTSTDQDSISENVFLRIAWYGSELLGIATSLLRPPVNTDPDRPDVKLTVGSAGVIDRAVVVESIQRDFDRAYFVTGNMTLDAYEENCEFADPAGSFKGLRRFKRNCSNFGALIKSFNMKLMKWEEFEEKGIGHWRFSCVMSFPWRPILSATGYTEYYYDKDSGKVCRHVEHWNVPKMTLFKQLLRPSRIRQK